MVCGVLEDRLVEERVVVSCATNLALLVSSCKFINLQTDIDGGAIFNEVSGLSLEITKSVFDGCHCKVNGGAMGVKSALLFKIHQNCFYKCYAEQSGQAYYAHTPSGSQHTFENSISYCSSEPNVGSNHVFYSHFGKFDFKNVNLSNSKLRSHSSMLIHDYTDFEVAFVLFSCSITSYLIEMRFLADSIPYDFTSLVFLNNTSAVSTKGSVFICQNQPTLVTFTSCLFIDQNYQKLAGSHPDTFVFDECVFFNSPSVGSVLQSMPAFLVQRMFSTYKCDAQVMGFTARFSISNQPLTLLPVLSVFTILSLE